MGRSDQARPVVSVVMPNHNGGRWLAEAVRSVLDQTLPAFELLIVDDGSTDGSLEMLAEFARRDARVRVIRQSRQGLAPALNRGLAEAAAPLIARLDADDLAHPTRLERQAGYLAEHPHIGVLGSWAQRINDSGRPRGFRTPATDPGELARRLERENPFVHSSIMARTELITRLGGYRQPFEAAEDYDLWLRAAEVADLANLPEVLVSYRVHDASVTRRQRLRQAFSVRLARRAAAARRDCGRDPAVGLVAPPDWDSPLSAGAFYARDAALFRWLDQADGARAPAGGCDRQGGEALLDELADLSHTERRLAALSLLAQLKGAGADLAQARRALGLILRLCRERPKTVWHVAWSLRPDSLRRRWPARRSLAPSRP